MKKLKAVIIDDEEFAREVIKEYLEDNELIEIIAEFEDGFTGLKGINELKPDLVFLDIQMPKLTGFEILEVMEYRPEIIFTTAYDQYAIDAFNSNAVDYLLKPFSKERFNAALQKIRLNDRKENQQKITNLEDSLDNYSEIINRIVVKKKSELRIIGADEIIFIEAQDDYVMIYLAGEKYLKQKTMNFYEKHLPSDQFIRVHRSYIARISQILKIEPYEKSSWVIIFKDGRKIPVSRAGLSKLKNILDI